ncbi:MAG: F0F1 ATP synthase subunit A [Oscillospiraceae bacterium]|nr:F0F1 ATP synthase subunit A [Oscillospiraceae bacterium]
MDYMRLMAEEGGYSVNGPMQVFEYDLFGMKLAFSESIVVEWIVILILGIVFFILGRNLKVRPTSKRQVIAEMMVSTFSGMVSDSMGIRYKKYTPYISALFCFSMLSSLMGLFGLRSPTADVSVVGAWGIITFILVQRNKFKTGGVKGFFKGFIEPMPFMLPFNLIGEVANPLSQTLRHFGNILTGMVIGGLIYYALGTFAIGVPAILSLYFDLFSSLIQAYIFVTLTMSYVAMAECD